MSETMMQEILKRLDAIGTKLGEAGVSVWTTLVTQAYWVEGWFSLVVDAIGAVVFIVIFVFCARYVTKGMVKGIDDDEGRIALVAIGGIVCLFGALLLVVLSVYSVRYILNPDYYALRELARLVGK